MEKKVSLAPINPFKAKNSLQVPFLEPTVTSLKRLPIFSNSMFGLTELILFVRKKRKLLGFLLLFNLVLSVIGMMMVLEQKYRAEATIVFNKVKFSFSGNRAEDYLFDEEFPAQFIYLMQSDSLIALSVKKHQLANHYDLPSTDPDRDKMAGEILRRKVLPQPSDLENEAALNISLMDEEKEMAEAVLMHLIENVGHFYALQIDDNNTVTEGVATHYSERLEKELSQANPEPPTFSSEAIRIRKMERQNELSGIIQQIRDNEDLPRYTPYFVINNGAVNATYKFSIVLVLAIVANIIALIFELQLLYILNYILQLFRKQEELIEKR